MRAGWSVKKEKAGVCGAERASGRRCVTWELRQARGGSGWLSRHLSWSQGSGKQWRAGWRQARPLETRHIPGRDGRRQSRVSAKLDGAGGSKR